MSISSNSVRKAISKRTPSVELSDEAKGAISVIRGLLKTRKRITTIKDVDVEYTALEGQSVPFTKFGFTTLTDFLRSCGDFHVSKNNEEFLISLKLSKNNESIASQIQSKSKKPIMTKRYIPRNSDTQSTNWRSPTTKSISSTSSPSKGSKKGEDSAKDTQDLREVLNRRNGTAKGGQSPATEYRSASLLMRQSSKGAKLDSNNNAINGEKSKIEAAPVVSPPRSGTIKATALPFIPTAAAAAQTKIKIEHPSKRSVNHRLKVHLPGGGEKSNSVTSQSEDMRSEHTASSSARTPTPPLPTVNANTLSPTGVEGNQIEELRRLCDAMNIEDLKYELFRKGETVACRVFVNKHAYYASLADECRDELTAKCVASQNALHALHGELDRKKFPVCPDDDYTVAGMIYEMLRSYSQGVFERVIPEYFQKVYGLSLPDHWTGIIGSYSKYFTVERGISQCFLVFANEGTGTGTNSESGANDSMATATHPDGGEVEKLGLPWTEKYWNVYISNPASTTTVWARIIGEEYSNRMDAMMTDIELCMISDQKKANVIELRRVYLVEAASCWYRVRCQQMDFENNRALCFFIDIGEEEWFKMDQLFVCESTFLKLPPQVLMLSLYGLDGFEDNPHAKPHLEKVLAGKTAVAEVISRPEEYEEGQRIKALLFDTSGEEDVNLVELLLTEICAATPPPHLERAGVTDVKISHISDEGDVYCQIRNSGIGYIQKLTDSVICNREALDRHQGLAEGSSSGAGDSSARFLIYDRLSASWFRATVEERRPLNKEHKMFCIDFGCSKVVCEKDIHLIEPLSMALNKYPPLAVKCRLFNIPTVTETVVARMKALLAPDTTTLVKMSMQGSVPQVIIYKRLETNDIMFCVNETLRVEQELDGLEIKNLIARDSTSPKAATGAGAKNKTTTTPSSGGVAVAAQSTKVKSLPSLKDIPLPSVNSFFNVFVTLASNPFNFVAQPYDQRADFHEMMRQMQAYCASNNEFLTTECVEVGQFYAAQHADGKWLRATVERMFDGSIHVAFCDYGEIAVLGIDKLKMLPDEFRILPKQAIKCRLYGITPINKDWTTHDCVKFNKLTVDKRFVAVIKGIRPDEFFVNEKIIELVLIDTSAEVDVNVNEVLKNEGRAIAANP